MIERQSPEGGTFKVTKVQLSPTETSKICEKSICNCDKKIETSKKTRHLLSTAQKENLNKNIKLYRNYSCKNFLSGLKVQLPPEEISNESTQQEKRSEGPCNIAEVGEHTLYFNNVNSTKFQKDLVARLTSSLCGLIDHQLISEKSSQNEKYALKLHLTLVPEISNKTDNAATDNLKNISSKSKNQTKRHTRLKYANCPESVFQPEDGQNNCDERTKHYHQIPGTERVRTQLDNEDKNERHQKQHRKPLFNQGIKRVSSEAWSKKRVSPSDEKFHEMLNLRLRQWQNQEDLLKNSQKQSPQTKHVNKTTKQKSKLLTSSTSSSLSNSEYGGDDDKGSCEVLVPSSSASVLRLYQPVSREEVGATILPVLLSNERKVTNCKKVKRKKNKAKANCSANGEKYIRSGEDKKVQELQEPSTRGNHGYLRANSIDPGAPCPFPNTPGVTATPFAIVPLSGKQNEPISLVVQKHKHVHHHHHHYYHPDS